jgi:hypothetical protein
MFDLFVERRKACCEYEVELPISEIMLKKVGADVMSTPALGGIIFTQFNCLARNINPYNILKTGRCETFSELSKPAS